jgi:hypothetical protein
MSRLFVRVFGLVFGLVLAPACAGCSAIFPHTTEPAARGPIEPASDAAVLVLHRPSAFGLEGPADQLPVAERWMVLRVLDEHGDPIADLRATEHAVVRLAPGLHELFASAWGRALDRECIGVMRAELAAGRVYAARVYAWNHSPKRHCPRVDIVAVPAVEHVAFAGELARSERVAFLGARRERSFLVDDLDLRLSTVAQGRLRMTDDPTWPATRSVLHPTDALDLE